MARTVSIVAGPALAAPAQHGLATFERAARAKGWEIDRAASVEVARGDVIVLAALADASRALPFAPALGRPLDAPEALAVKKTSLGGKPAVLVAGADARGLMYALLDAADSVAAAGDPADLLGAIREIEERPTVRDRARSVYTMNRGYWESRFYSEDYWTRYFDTLRIPTSSRRRVFQTCAWSASPPKSGAAISPGWVASSSSRTAAAST
jgi:hypothetical protein